MSAIILSFGTRKGGNSAGSGVVEVSSLCEVNDEFNEHEPSGTGPFWRDSCDLVYPRVGRVGRRCGGEGGDESLVDSSLVFARELGCNGGVSVGLGVSSPNGASICGGGGCCCHCKSSAENTVGCSGGYAIPILGCVWLGRELDGHFDDIFSL